MNAPDPRIPDAPEDVSGAGAADDVPSPTDNAARSAADGTSSPPSPTESRPDAGQVQTDDVSEDAPVDVDLLQEQADKAGEYLALAQRTQADFENFRKRTARDASVATQRGAMKLAKELLPAVDNLERALAHAPEQSSESEQAFIDGVKHVHADLIGALQRAGIERYSPEGEPFDPTLHEAVAQQPFEGYEPGTVVEVFQRGYRIGESVVRPARVVVAG